MSSRVVLFFSAVALFLFSAPTPAAAQDAFHPRWEIPGFDFRPNGAWRVRAQQVSAYRRQLIATRNFAALNAPMARTPGGAQGPATAMAATHTVPAILFSYANTDPSLTRDTSQYNALLFSTSPPVVGVIQNPYTVRTFYEQLSNNLLSMRGQVFGWVRLDSNETFYTGTPGTCSGNPFGNTNCNGIFSAAAVNAMQNGMRAALAHIDSFVDFGKFDNDGPDGIPNSGDDDGYVDMIMFAHATRDGACGNINGNNNHIWSHRFVFVNSTETNYQDYVTNDTSYAVNGPPDHHIHISDYFMASGLGGRTSCDTTQIMPIGTASHEFGHALGLPDLYDTRGPTEGIGQWGLMGSGNFTAAYSPSRYEAWSLNEMGWTTVVPLTTTGTYRLRAEPISDSIYLINPTVSNPRSESFLVENRQGYQSDTALIRLHCARSVQIGQIASGSPCGGGLLIWHVDGQKIASSGFHNGNTVNYLLPHGLVLEQADGLDQLDSPSALSRRGDAGDPYPGVTNNPSFTPRSNPAPKMNSDGSFPGFTIDSIRLTGGPDSEMAFRLRFGALTIVRGSDTNAVVQVDGNSFNVFRDLFDNGSSHTVNDTNQVSPDGRRRFRFLSWSDGGAQSHSITGSLAGATITANLSSDYKLIATAVTGGTIQADTNVDLAGGAFIPSGRAVTLTATAAAGNSFSGWSGDTTTSNTVVVLPMGRPYTVTANFLGALTTANVVAQLLGPTQPLTTAQIQYLDQHGNNNGVFDLGDFLAWVKATGAPLSPAVLQALAQKGGRK
ncbi:MAG TPA: M6 family metalloprotease domain-containing protein [Gemmatimonadales bacterium]|nr:M6 family metalloprotease domain-containing protein [Gemmatimonadales bacterium]